MNEHEKNYDRHILKLLISGDEVKQSAIEKCGEVTKLFIVGAQKAADAAKKVTLQSALIALE